MDAKTAIFKDIFAAPENRNHAPASIAEPEPSGDGVRPDPGIAIANEVLVSLGYCRTSGPIDYSDEKAHYGRLAPDGRVFYRRIEWDAGSNVFRPEHVGEEFPEDPASKKLVAGRPIGL